MDLSSISAAQVMSLPPDELGVRMLRAITAGEDRNGLFLRQGPRHQPERD
jgi:hypothetical protein